MGDPLISPVIHEHNLTNCLFLFKKETVLFMNDVTYVALSVVRRRVGEVLAIVNIFQEKVAALLH